MKKLHLHVLRRKLPLLRHKLWQEFMMTNVTGNTYTIFQKVKKTPVTNAYPLQLKIPKATKHHLE